VRDPRRFFALLQTLGVAFPEVRWQAPTQPRGWLCKDPTGSGGWHIRRATDAAVPPPGAYFQREIAGLPASALFIADGTRSAILGHNELLVTAHGARPFVYRGAIGPIDLPGTLRVRLQAALDRIVAATALRGLGSFDFVCDGERFYALEINPRPSATMALYDADYPQGLLAAHVAACRRRELPAVRQARAVRAQAIVFAPRTVRVARSEALLALGCRDVPPPGTMVPAGAPLCSVTAAASNAAQVRAELARRADRVIARVESETDERCPTC
jgi:predicted ATP-grasp superfamily ATP-dependent carboligase